MNAIDELIATHKEREQAYLNAHKTLVLSVRLLPPVVSQPIPELASYEGQEEEGGCGWVPDAQVSRSTILSSLGIFAIVVAIIVLASGGLSSPSTSSSSPHSTRSTSVKGSALASASSRLVRIDQTNCTTGQYASTQDCSTWSPSTCSTTAMTEVMNAWGKHLHIADTLKVESGLGYITADAGLLGQQGIDHTVAQFGFATQWLSSPSLATIEAYGNVGYPVIIGFSNDRWLGGHWLVVLGSYVDAQGTRYVHLADSSSLNMQYMREGSPTEAKTFAYYWAGMAAIVTPQGISATIAPYSVVGSPTISAGFINTVLAQAGSPAAGTGQALYDDGVKYGIDPAFALAFFHHESSYGTAGEARSSLSLGNLRCISGYQCPDGYAWFPSWQAGYEAWYALIRYAYVGKWGLTTVDKVIPTYAPTSDHNDEAAYIAAVEHDIDTYRQGASA